MIPFFRFAWGIPAGSKITDIYANVLSWNKRTYKLTSTYIHQSVVILKPPTCNVNNADYYVSVVKGWGILGIKGTVRS